ncbi:hypothetical protein [uncultured Granulicatella sp.]|uniref:hypothetical protein n=1 Tax=uncultured Granulicatella sp. TaxID=316089 RepID=UPI0028D14CC2|nr:hypothetical protein [uncultured Granulicatella sp.]
MKDLEQLKQQVLKEVEEDFSHQLAVATKEEEERTNVMNATLAEQEVAKKTQLKQRAKQLWDKEKQSLVNASKKEILQEKRRLLDSVFDEVYSLMSGWSGVTLVQFIQSAVAQLPKQEKITLVLGEATASQLSQEDIHQLTNVSELEVSQTTLKQKVGFVLQQSGIEYNYLFDALLKDLKQEYSPELAKKAFER